MASLKSIFMIKNNLYTEQQRFTPIWISILLLILWLYLIYRTYQQIFMNISLGDSPMSNSGLILFDAIMLVVIYILSTLSLRLAIQEKFIDIQFFPIHRKRILFKNIKKAEIITYKVIGSGIRVSVKYGTIYRVGGNKGLFIELENGDKILVGTKNKKEVEKALLGIKNPVPNNGYKQLGRK